MKLGVMLPAAQVDEQDFTPGWPEVRSFALESEARGLDSVWMHDHFFGRFDSGRIQGMHEAWTIVGAVAAVTQRVEIGTAVLCTSFRSPGLVANMAAAADEVSDGRLILGLGAGWFDPEYEAFGYPADHRADRFEEALQIIVPLLRGEVVGFTGRHHEVHGAVLAPPPRRHIPVLIGCEGRRMMRLAARYADAWHTNGFGEPTARLHDLLSSLDEALEVEGRDPATMMRTLGVTVRDPSSDALPDEEEFAGSVDDLARLIDAYASLGIDHLIILLVPMTLRSLDRLARAVELRSN